MHLPRSTLIALAVASLALLGSSGCATYAAAKVMGEIKTTKHAAITDVQRLQLERLANGTARLRFDLQLDDGKNFEPTLVVTRHSGRNKLIDDQMTDGNSSDEYLEGEAAEKSIWKASAASVPFVVVLDGKLPPLVRPGIAVHRVNDHGEIQPTSTKLTEEEFSDHAILVLRLAADECRVTGWIHMPPDGESRSDVPFLLYEESELEFPFALETPGESRFLASLGKGAIGTLIYPLAVIFDVASLAFLFV